MPCFSASEAGSSFACKIDKSSFKRCGSSKKFTVRKGKHTISVRATDAAGNVDASPATVAFKVKRAKAKHKP